MPESDYNSASGRVLPAFHWGLRSTISGIIAHGWWMNWHIMAAYMLGRYRRSRRCRLVPSRHHAHRRDRAQAPSSEAARHVPDRWCRIDGHRLTSLNGIRSLRLSLFLMNERRPCAASVTAF